MAESGGPALKTAIHVARARAGITSDMQLALRAHVSYDTLMNWYGNKTVPRGAELQKVARALGISYSMLEAAYAGREAEPPPLQDAIKELAASLGNQTDAITALVAELRLSRAAQVEATEVVFHALGALGARQDPQGTRPGTEPEAPAGTARR